MNGARRDWRAAGYMFAIGLASAACAGGAAAGSKTQTTGWPLTVPEARAAAAGPAPASEWPAEEISSARARCASLLSGRRAVALAEPPFRRGPCGAPAPVRLVSLGQSPEVALFPPALVTCDMAAALDGWLKRDLQPLARKHLGGDIIRIEIMSDYSCRNAYGSVRARLSEHSRARALDIRGFVTSRGTAPAVLAGWGPTAGDMRALAAAETAAKAPRLAGKPAKPSPAAATVDGQPEAVLSAFSDFLGLSSPSPQSLTLSGEPGAMRYSPDKLGGPAPAAAANTPEARFLRAAHQAACKTFRTVLGPEANAFHRNHFHVDLSERAGPSICE